MRDILKFGLIGPKMEKYMFGAPECPVSLHGTPQGLQGAPFDLSYTQNARQDGETFKNRRFKRNPIVLDVVIGNRVKPGPKHRLIHDQWRQALGDGVEECRFVVVSNESGYRWKHCRLQDATQAADWQRPGLLGRNREQVTLASDDAFWTHPDQHREFGKGQFQQAEIHNPGDRPAWLTWTLLGKTDGWAIGVGDDLIEVPPFPFWHGLLPSEGDDDYDPGIDDMAAVRIHTAPEFPTATMSHPGFTREELPDGIPGLPTEPWTEDLYERDFRGVPDGWSEASSDLIFREPLPGGGNGTGMIPLNIRARNPQDSARVVVEFTPKSRNAW